MAEEKRTPEQEQAAAALEIDRLNVIDKIKDLLVNPLEARGHKVVLRPRDAWTPHNLLLIVTDRKTPDQIGNARILNEVTVEFEMKLKISGPRYGIGSEHRVTIYTGTTMYKHSMGYQAARTERPKKFTPERATEILDFIVNWIAHARHTAGRAKDKAEGLGPQIIKVLTEATPAGAKRKIDLGSGAHIDKIVVTDVFKDHETTSVFALSAEVKRGLVLRTERTDWGIPGAFRHAL